MTKTAIDVCILSNAKTLKHYWMTQNAINSILASSDQIDFNIIVMETAEKAPDGTEKAKPWIEDKCYGVTAENGVIRIDGHPYKLDTPFNGFVWIEEQKHRILARVGADYQQIMKIDYIKPSTGPVSYTGAKTVQANLPFNYNECINTALKNHSGPGEWFCVLNNDTITYPGAFDAMIASGYDSVSPTSAINASGQNGVVGIEEGYQICRQIAGWCILTKKSVFSKLIMGKMPEHLFYFHQDCTYSMELERLGIKHALVSSARIDHLQCQSHPETPIEMAWSLESTRRFYRMWPEDYGVWKTGNHTGNWSEGEIFDKVWLETNDKLFADWDKAKNAKKTRKRRVKAP